MQCKQKFAFLLQVTGSRAKRQRPNAGLTQIERFEDLKADSGGLDAHPWRNSSTRWAGAGFIPARRESTVAVALVQKSLNLELRKSFVFWDLGGVR